MSEASTSPGRILLLASGGLEAAHRLLGAITHPQLPPLLCKTSINHAWSLDTKYYCADVVIELRDVDQCSFVRLEDGEYEAAILVFDVSAHDSFDRLQRWWEAAGGTAADLPVRLMVASGAAQRPSWMDSVEGWCADQLVELVEVAEAAEPAVTAGPRSTAGSDASGVQRLREALEANMWPGMQLKPSPRRGTIGDAGSAADVQQAGSDDHAVQDAAPASSIPAPNGLHASSGGAAAAAAAAAVDDDLSFADYLRLSTEVAQAAAGGQQGTGSGAAAAAPFEEEEDDAEVEQLERLFAQVASHRDRLAQMPDAQRREAAAAMVMQLMAAMGMDGEDEGAWQEDEE